MTITERSECPTDTAKSMIEVGQNFVILGDRAGLATAPDPLTGVCSVTLVERGIEAGD